MELGWEVNGGSEAARRTREGDGDDVRRVVGYARERKRSGWRAQITALPCHLEASPTPPQGFDYSLFFRVCLGNKGRYCPKGEKGANYVDAVTCAARALAGTLHPSCM